MAAAEHYNGLWTRGVKGRDVAGTLAFVGLRAVDPLLQYSILARGSGAAIISKLGGTVLTAGRPSETGISAIDSLNLTPFRLILVAMSTATAMKQVFWMLFISDEPIPLGSSMIISFNNTFLSCLGSLLYVWNPASGALEVGEGPDSAHWPGSRLLIGSTLFTVGILTELISEIQRKAFKDKPENKGKPYTGGLFALARHINYGGYILMRAGQMLATSGWLYCAFIMGLSLPVFITKSVPEIQKYCSERYGLQWQEYEKQTPYKLLPYIY